jgi:uncharacterized protein
VKLIRKSEQITTSWSGGTTTQLFIYPENANYQERNFLFRISTATVETEESVFTKLPGISRQIMILAGTLKLEHTGRYTKILQKFETDSFEGDWETRGYGKVTDFNLMTTGKLQGTIYGTVMKKDETIQFQSIQQEQFVGLYVLKGIIEVLSGGLSLIGHEGDFILAMTGENVKRMTVCATEESEIAIARITFPDFQ